MKLDDIFSELSANMVNSYIENLNNHSPDDLEEITNLFNNLTELAINILKVNSEFRMNFAKIHSEFLKYPECQQVIDNAIYAAEQYKPDMFDSE